MRFLIALIIGIGLFSSRPALATTLRLPEEMELLIVDGAPLGSSLLRGADSLELERGRHQLVFTVSRKESGAGENRQTYTSSYIVAQFHTRDARQLTFLLPALTTQSEREHFSRQPLIRLIDQNGAVVEAVFSRLPSDGAALMDALRRYNINQNPPPTLSPSS